MPLLKLHTYDCIPSRFLKASVIFAYGYDSLITSGFKFKCLIISVKLIIRDIQNYPATRSYSLLFKEQEIMRTETFV